MGATMQPPCEPSTIALCDEAKKQLRNSLAAKEIDVQQFKAQLALLQQHRHTLTDSAAPLLSCGPSDLPGDCLDRVLMRDAAGLHRFPAQCTDTPKGVHAAGCPCGHCLGGTQPADCPFVLREALEASHCEALKSVADQYARSRGGWGVPNRQRHRQFPTTDMAFQDLKALEPELFAVFRERISELILPVMRTIYRAQRLQLSEAFIVRYSAADGAQNHLPVHTDGSTYSFNLLLSEATDFEGGGTWFELLDSTLHLERGQVLMHRGDLRHGGQVVTEGVRHILVGFVDAL